MPRAECRGLIQTVLGLIPPAELGPTTTHEHVYADYSPTLRPAQNLPSDRLAEAPVTLENLGWIRRNYYSNRANLQLTDLSVAVNKLATYRDLGGDAIVDATTTGIGRDPGALAQISRESGVHIIMGSGFYVDVLHPDGMDERSVDGLAREITLDLTRGPVGAGLEYGYSHVLRVVKAGGAGPVF